MYLLRGHGFKKTATFEAKKKQKLGYVSKTIDFAGKMMRADNCKFVYIYLKFF